ncbi:Rab3 GTPase-activating protein catalytic subunit [Mortierella alpina]|uniref:Rab3 GTPase-activating protein catalytic subunit n=1 Tax=Mortierella alpina TaxID=64518 RepID=A0A9P6JD71_MORAP|nr:Rab3 GTPase-activating protein catalytic subunit [Mortierella alpina]
MDMDDFESFEFIDYTTAGPWERFIVQIEDSLKQWGLVHNSYGVFNPDVMPTTEGSVNLDQELAWALNEEQHLPPSSPPPTLPLPPTTNSGTDADTASPAPLPSRVYQHSATVTLESDSYLLTYHYHPAKARIASGVEQIDLDFLPTSLEGVQHHSLHRWTALTHILVLSPLPDASTHIIDLGTAKLLLSSFAIAFQNSGCNVPVFVPTGLPKNRTYTGLSIQPQLLHARDSELGLEETAEDQAIEVRFNTVLVPYPPAQYTNLSGILDLFIERMGIEDEYDGSSAGVDGVDEHSQATKEQIYVSGLFSYQHDKWFDSGDEWRQWSGSTSAEDRPSEEETSAQEPNLPFGPVQDPVKTLQLVARFASAPSTVYLDSKSFTEMDASQANIWLLKPSFRTDDYGILCGILEDVIASWSMEASSSLRMSSREQGSSEKEHHSYGSLLRRRHAPSADVGGTTRVVSAAELSLHFRHATIVPYSSFLWKMVKHLVDVVSPDSHITYPTSFMGFLKAVWTEVIKELENYWERGEMIPWVDVYSASASDPVDTDDASPADSDVDSPYQKPRIEAIDLRFNLMHQKLSMINCCIARERRQSQNHPTQTSAPNLSARESSAYFSASSSPASSAASSPKSSSESTATCLPAIPPIPQESTGVDHSASADENEIGDIARDNQQDSEAQAVGSIISGDSDEVSPSPEPTSSDEGEVALGTRVAVTPLEEPIARQGVLKRLGDLTLLETGAPLMIPKLQDPGYMTEDMIQEQEELFEDLGSSADAAKTRAGMQSAQLISDMSAFKAANPGCVLGDFVRWHSPKDWIEDKNAMSARMSESGNFWQELWTISDPVPAARQTPLMNHRNEALRALSSLKALSGTQLFAHQRLARMLQDLARELTEFPWDELAMTEKDLGLKPMLAKFRQAEMLAARVIALLHKFPHQFHLAERILEEAESVVEDGTERDCVYNLFAAGGSTPFPKPNCRELVIETFDPASSLSTSRPTFVSSGDLTGWHARPLQRRMYACFKDSEARIVEAIAKDGMFM